MDFTFTEEQLLFRDTVRGFLREQVTSDKIRQRWQTETGRDEVLWQQFVEMGITSLLVPESCGGLGKNEQDFVLLAQECGGVALPEPLVDIALVVTPLLNSLVADAEPHIANRCRELLQGIASGNAKVAVCHSVNELLNDAHIADWLLMAEGDQVHLLAAADVQFKQRESIDPARKLYEVDWKSSDTSCLASGTEGIALHAASLNRGALGAAAQMLGLADTMLSMTVEYTAQRQQFGRAVGANQAIKHAMADCAVKIEFAKAPLYRAAFVLSESPAHADFAVSQAKVAAGLAALMTAKKCIQAHGAMGYTWECDLHIFMKRAWALDKFWGHSGFHKNRLHQWLLNPHAKIGADKTFGEQNKAESQLSEIADA